MSEAAISQQQYEKRIYIVAVWTELLIVLLLGKVMNCPERQDVQGICSKLQNTSYEMWV